MGMFARAPPVLGWPLFLAKFLVCMEALQVRFSKAHPSRPRFIRFGPFALCTFYHNLNLVRFLPTLYLFFRAAGLP